MMSRQTQDIYVKSKRKDQEVMKTTGNKHKRIRTDKKKQLALLKPLKCRYCPRRFFSNTPSYLSHVHKHATRLKSYWYKNLGSYVPQAATKVDDHCMVKNHNCRFCSKGFTTTTWKTCHEKYEHICDYCEKNFENAMAKKLHGMKKHNMEDINKCCFCRRQFATAKGKAVHERYEHICDFCEEMFENVQDKKRHKQDVHDNKGQFLCLFCRKHFATVYMKTLHEKSEHLCETCNKMFANAEDKKHHKCVEKKCCFCYKYFATLKGKMNHEKSIHICDFPPCKEVPFKSAKMKKRHILEKHTENNTNVVYVAYVTQHE